MSLQLLVVAIIGFVIGVGVESVGSIGFYTVVWVLFLALVVGMVWRRAREACPAPYLALVSVFLLTLALGIFRTQLFEAQFTNPLITAVDTEVTLVGQVIKEPDRRTQRQLVTMAYQDTVIRVSADNNVPILYGDSIEVTGELQVPQSFETDLGRTFNYAGYLKAKRTEYTISFVEVTVLASNQGNPLVANLLRFKHSFMEELDQVLTEPAGALADGLLLGLNQGLGDSLEEDFRRSGIIHIVVLSGYNIMLVVTFVMFLLSFFLRQRWRLLFGLIAIASFALIVGLSATVVRASIMASLLLLAQTLGRTYAVLRALLIAGLIMLVVNPYLLLFDIGFQLSFMATLGLIAALPWLSAQEQPEVLTSVRGYVVATIATQIAVLPLLIYHIGEVSVVSVLVNVLVLPAVPFAMFGAFVSATVHYLLPTIGLLFGAITEGILTYIILVAEWFSALPFAVIGFSELSPWLILLMYAVLGYGYWWIAWRTPRGNSTIADWEIVEEAEAKSEVDHRSTSPETSVPKLFR